MRETFSTGLLYILIEMPVNSKANRRENFGYV